MTRAEQATQGLTVVDVGGEGGEVMEVRDGNGGWRTPAAVWEAALEVLGELPALTEEELASGCEGAYTELCAEVRRISRTAVGQDAVAVVEADRAGVTPVGYHLTAVVECADGTDDSPRPMPADEALVRFGDGDGDRFLSPGGELFRFRRQPITGSRLRALAELQPEEARQLVAEDPTLVRIAAGSGRSVGASTPSPSQGPSSDGHDVAVATVRAALSDLGAVVQQVVDARRPEMFDLVAVVQRLTFALESPTLGLGRRAQ